MKAILSLVGCVVLGVAANALTAADYEVLVIEQNYNIVESGKDGPHAKDTRQVLYFSKDSICIDEMGGRDGKPTESIVLDMKNKKIINLNHVDKKMVSEDFDTRRQKIKRKKEQVREDLNQPAGPQRDRVAKLYRSLLDDDRKFVLEGGRSAPKEIGGVECKSVRVTDPADPSYVPLEAYVHPSIELPHDNAEVLYLIMLIGEKMSEFLKRNREVMKKVPMELHLDLAAGGKLDTQVLSVKKVPHDKLDLSSRGTLGDPFSIPQYEVRERRPTPRNDKDRAD